MKISTKFIALSLSAAAVVAALSVTVVVEENRLANGYHELINGPIQQAQLMRKLQVDFKGQNQAWQNLLLHGTNPTDIGKLGLQFHNQQSLVQVQVEAMQEKITNPEIKEEFVDFTEKYNDLNKRYESAVNLFTQTQDGKKAELLVYGVDLAPTAMIDEMVVKITEDSMKRAHDLSVGSRRHMTIMIACTTLLIVAFVCISMFVVRQVVRRLARLKDVSERISRADLDGLSQEMAKNDLVGSGDEVGELALSMQALGGYFSEIVDGLNKLAAGDLSMQVQPRSAQDPLARSYKRTVDSIAALVEDARMLVGAGISGELSLRADLDRHDGEYRKIVLGYNQMLDAVVGPLNVAADYVDRIGRGDIPPKIDNQYQGDFKALVSNLNACLDGLEGLVEANEVLQKISRNDLSKQVKGEYLGVFAEVGEAVNGVHFQLKNITEVFNKISQGDIKAKRVEIEKIGKRSDNDQMIPAILRTMQSIELLVQDADMLAQAAGEGRMNVRADASHHSGDYRMVVEGMNNVLAAVSAPLHASADNAQWLASSSEELIAVSQQMAESASDTAAQAGVVSAASEEVSKNVASVATASEQMQASIREISKSANESARVAGNAVTMAGSTNETMRKLGESSQEIGDVIKVIASIAEQTNLLALNATIEAARAGEAGKGFAVVANEVKELAKQTAKATEEIGRKIEAIQSVSSGAVSAIEEIGTVINQINDLSNTIASAVEEQTATTNEIGRSVNEAASGVSEIARNISGVAEAANHATQGAEGTKAASFELSKMASSLQTIVSKYSF